MGGLCRQNLQGNYISLIRSVVLNADHKLFEGSLWFMLVTVSSSEILACTHCCNINVCNRKERLSSLLCSHLLLFQSLIFYK